MAGPRRPALGGAGPHGKRLTPPAGGGSERALEGDEARHAVDEESRSTTSRQQLGRHPGFSEISPELGILDEDAFDRALTDDADETLGLLADLIGATDERLRAAARRLAARVMLEVGQKGTVRRKGSGRRRLEPADRAEGDLDLDASLDALVVARASRQPPALDELRVATWSRPVTALSLVVDRSGSMGGERLATAAVGAAACAHRAGVDLSVIAFSDTAIVVKAQDEPRPAELVAEDLLRLRGRGTTDLGLALLTARDQLARSTAGRRVVILLSDCRPTAGLDPDPIAASLEELCVVAPADDSDDAAMLARAAGARWAPVEGPSSLPAALRTLLDP